MRADETVLDGHAARPDMFPAREILTVKKLFPFSRLRGQGKRGQDDCQKKESSATHFSPRKLKIALRRGIIVLSRSGGSFADDEVCLYGMILPFNTPIGMK
jgi:hypothetical protein